MALIGKIRKNSWLLIVLIGVGLLSFIVMDMTSGQQSVFGGGQTTMAKVEGEKIDWYKFSNTEKVLYQGVTGDPYARRQQLYDFFVEKVLVDQEADDLGLQVSKEELMDLQFGASPSPIIRQRFSDPQAPGQINRQQLTQIKQIIENGQIRQSIEEGQLSPNFVPFWSHQEKEIIKERLQSKMNALVSKAMYMPSWMVEMEYQAQNERVDFAYVKIPFDELDNTEVTLTDADYRAFMEEKEAQYRTEEETRQLEYVVFNVQATAEDSAQWRKQIADLVPDFRTAVNDSNFVDRNYGTISANYLAASDVSPIIADTVFSLPSGSVYGPYIDGNQYKAVKVVDNQMIADSADTRHILISATTPASFQIAASRVDSLIGVLESGAASFDSLALQFSEDPGSSSNGGLYENVTPNQFVPEFNKVLFVTGEIGEYYKVRTQFGVHLVEVLKRSASKTPRAQLAYIQQSIIPTEDTQNELYDEVLQIVGKNRTIDALRQVVSERADLSLTTSPAIKQNDFTIGTLGGGQATRDMIRWAFGASEGEVSPEVFGYQDQAEYYTNKYVVAALKDINKAGMPSVDAVKDQIQQQVINRKKGEMIAGKISSKDLSQIASQYSTQVDTASNVSFTTSFVPELGAEPKVIGAAFEMAQDEVSEPIVGTSGVYVVKMVRKPVAAQPTNIPQLRPNFQRTERNKVNGRLLIQAMKKNADVTDNRFRFY
ncbi:MAG: peptidylprolyl isomerase [Saprospiraceae bacterium]|nr:peptidylprolyl isomerase [Saprospiraceae bacterium]